MAIARKPNSNRLIPADKAAEQAANAFIQGAAKPEQNTPAPDARKTPIMLRFDGELLRRVDLAAKRRGISRSAWIAFKVSEALDAEGS
jgi:predicted HicB family RNase H-like nuclease